MRAVIFDLDGVLINSEPVWDDVRRGLAEQSRRPWPDYATRAMQGMSTAEWSAFLVDTVGIPGTPVDVAEQVISGVQQRYATQLPIIPGAVEAVSRLAGLYPLGLASSSPRRLIDAVLESSGLAGYFEISVSTEEVAAGKPSPAVYLEAVHRLDVAPAQAAAVEDSSNGLRSASAAGLHVVAVPHEAFPPSPDALALADERVSELAELTAELFDRLG